jgi:hypothetical protein
MLTAKQRHRLLMADRTHDAGWVAAVIEILTEVAAALRDAAAHSYVIGDVGKFRIVIGMPAMLAAVDAAGGSIEQNRTALAKVAARGK